ncbi:hypothetical protein ACYZTR_04680 [Pseudomonas sp. Hz4]
MGWRDKLDAAIQKNKEKIVEIVTVENAKKPCPRLLLRLQLQLLKKCERKSESSENDGSSLKANQMMFSIASQNLQRESPMPVPGWQRMYWKSVLGV